MFGSSPVPYPMGNCMDTSGPHQWQLSLKGPNKVLIIPTQNFKESRYPDDYFWHHTTAHTFNPDSSPDFAFKSRIPSFK